MIQNYHILRIKYIGPTNHNGSRVKIISDRFQQSKTIDYDHRFSRITDMAEAWLKEHGFNIIGTGELKNEDVLISTTFEPIKGAKPIGSIDFDMKTIGIGAAAFAAIYLLTK